MSKACQVCCDDYGKECVKVECGFCEYDACTWCVRQYLLGTPENAHCMKCRNGWKRDFLMEKLPAKFVLEEYKKHRENVLFEMEKSLLPATQEQAENVQRQRNQQQIIKEVKKQYELKKEALFELQPELADVEVLLDDLKKRMNDVLPKLPPYINTKDSVNELLKKNSLYGICRFPICKECEEYIRLTDRDHKCLPENLAKVPLRKKLSTEYNELMVTSQGKAYEVFQEKLLEMKRETNRVIYELRAHFRNSQNMGQPVAERKSFVRSCPADGCRGFLSNGWKCGLCEVHVCSKCHEIKKGDDHECNPELVETAKFLMKDSKSCPTCGVRIHKISGCSQIWCTQCHTAWDWNTGNIVKNGQIHNPHYYEYLREKGIVRREIGDVPCGGLPAYVTIYRVIYTLGMGVQIDMKRLEDYHRLAGEVMELREWYHERNLADNTEVRVKYLLKDYDEPMFKKTLQMRAKALEKVQNIDQILDMFVMAISSIFQRMTQSKTIEEFVCILSEMDELRKYMNESMKTVGKVFQCKYPWIDEQLQLHKVGERKATTSS